MPASREPVAWVEGSVKRRMKSCLTFRRKWAFFRGVAGRAGRHVFVCRAFRQGQNRGIKHLPSAPWRRELVRLRAPEASSQACVVKFHNPEIDFHHAKSLIVAVQNNILNAAI